MTISGHKRGAESSFHPMFRTLCQYTPNLDWAVRGCTASGTDDSTADSWSNLFWELKHKRRVVFISARLMHERFSCYMPMNSAITGIIWYRLPSVDVIPLELPRMLNFQKTARSRAYMRNRWKARSKHYCIYGCIPFAVSTCLSPFPLCQPSSYLILFAICNCDTTKLVSLVAKRENEIRLAYCPQWNLNPSWSSQLPSLRQHSLSIFHCLPRTLRLNGTNARVQGHTRYLNV